MLRQGVACRSWPHATNWSSASRFAASPSSPCRPILRARSAAQATALASVPANPLASRRRLLSTTPLRRLQPEGGPFRQVVPPSPASLGRPRAARTYTRSRKWARRLLILSAVLGTLYTADRQLYASGIARSARTFGLGVLVALDYKINFRPEPLAGGWGGGGDVQELHRRNAERLFNLLRQNGGLYLKIGQAIAMQTAVLPPEFQRMFARMFDDAPQDEWADVERVIREDFGGKSVEEVFGVSFAGAEGKGVMERTARASASVAQVHWARLPDGREVAIKIQKPEIAKQIGWDLWAFKVVAKVYTVLFDLPLYSLVPFITERLMLETDFENEAKNSELMRRLVSQEPSLRGKVYIPPVYSELSSKRVLTTEWIEGVRLWDRDSMTAPWLGGYGKGSPGSRQAPLSVVDMNALRREIRENPSVEKLKPERTEWKGSRGKGGLGVTTKDVMTTMVTLFSAQIFKWGVVHCDPHPGNIFIRRLPNGRAELVLIDHGLYVYMTPKFRHEYSVFWKALMTFDDKTIAKVTQEWGIQAAELFASATLMRPYEGGEGQFQKDMMGDLKGKTESERHYEMQQRMKQGIRDILGDGDKLPKELLFIGRNMRIVQADNQYMGSPVNRIKMMGEMASRSLFQDPNLPWRERAQNAWRHVLFKAVMTASDVLFYFFKARQLLGLGGGMEDEMEARMKDMAKDFGVELQHEVFEG